jgi:hypothetical protein
MDTLMYNHTHTESETLHDSFPLKYMSTTYWEPGQLSGLVLGYGLDDQGFKC